MFLDTCFVIDLIRETSKGKEGPAMQKLMEMKNFPVYISLFSACELMGGIEKSTHPEEERRKVEIFLDQLTVVYPSSGYEVVYGEVYGMLAKKGKMIPQMDLLIGCMAKMQNMPLVTKDTAHFSRIPGLVISTY